MNNITNFQHDYKIGRFYLTVGASDVTIHDTVDRNCILSEEISTEELKELSKALYRSALIREKSNEMIFDLEHEKAMGMEGV